MVNYNDVMGGIETLDPRTGITTTSTPVWTPLPVHARPENNAITNTNYDYNVLAFNAKFFERRLVVLGALRQDDYIYSQRFAQFQAALPEGWDEVTLQYRENHPNAEEYYNLTYPEYIKKTKTFTGNFIPAQRRPRNGKTPDPLFDDYVFRDDFSPPEYNESVTTYSAGSVFFLDNKLR